MKRVVVRVALAIGAMVVLGCIIAASGVISIRASSGHWRATEWILRFGMKRSIATHSLGTEVPANLTDETLIRKGAAHYELACRSCHGEPQGPRPRVAAHMLPVPPDLGPRVRKSNPRKLFEVVKHGMKFTGMPAWPAPQRDDEVWAMVAFLLKYPDLSAADYRRLAGDEEFTQVRQVTASGVNPPPLAAQSCARCHGLDGLARGNTLVPHLAGQRSEYMRGALRGYASDRRQSGIMEPAVAELSAEVIAELADYYAGLSPAAHGPRPISKDPAAVARGELIAREGIRAQRVPACLECHGPTGHRTKPEYPLLGGQPADYLELQLTLFREDRRGGSDHAHLMQPIAERLTAQQAHDVAQFFASLAPASDAK